MEKCLVCFGPHYTGDCPDVLAAFGPVRHQQRYDNCNWPGCSNRRIGKKQTDTYCQEHAAEMGKLPEHEARRLRRNHTCRARKRRIDAEHGIVRQERGPNKKVRKDAIAY